MADYSTTCYIQWFMGQTAQDKIKRRREKGYSNPSWLDPLANFTHCQASLTTGLHEVVPFDTNAHSNIIDHSTLGVLGNIGNITTIFLRCSHACQAKYTVASLRSLSSRFHSS